MVGTIRKSLSENRSFRARVKINYYCLAHRIKFGKIDIIGEFVFKVRKFHFEKLYLSYEK